MGYYDKLLVHRIAISNTRINCPSSLIWSLSPQQPLFLNWMDIDWMDAAKFIHFWQLQLEVELRWLQISIRRLRAGPALQRPMLNFCQTHPYETWIVSQRGGRSCQWRRQSKKTSAQHVANAISDHHVNCKREYKIIIVKIQSAVSRRIGQDKNGRMKQPSQMHTRLSWSHATVMNSRVHDSC